MAVRERNEVALAAAIQPPLAPRVQGEGAGCTIDSRYGFSTLFEAELQEKCGELCLRTLAYVLLKFRDPQPVHSFAMLFE